MPINSWLLNALIDTESAGNDAQIGDHGLARGALQIHPEVVQDVNRIYGTAYRHTDAHDRRKAVDIATKYLSHYAGPSAPDEKLARVWNGGPHGHRKSATIPYWQKVRKALPKTGLRSSMQEPQTE
jgi:hypothetical protein